MYSFFFSNYYILVSVTVESIIETQGTRLEYTLTCNVKKKHVNGLEASLQCREC